MLKDPQQASQPSPRNRVIQSERDNRLQIVTGFQVEDERRVRDQEDQLLPAVLGWISGYLANLAHEKRLGLRMQIQFRFIDYEGLTFIVVQDESTARTTP